MCKETNFELYQLPKPLFSISIHGSCPNTSIFVQTLLSEWTDLILSAEVDSIPSHFRSLFATIHGSFYFWSIVDPLLLFQAFINLY